MKGKKEIALIIMAALSMCACTKETERSQDLSNEVSQKEASIETSNEGLSEGSNAAATTAISSNKPEQRYTREADDKSGLYTAFLNNEEQVTIELEHKYNDCAGIVDDDFKFDPGESINLKTLTERLSGAFSNDGEEVFLEHHRYIDCGNDGEKELLITFKLQETDPDYYSLVIKERDGKLYLRYGKYGENSYISDDGYIHSSGKYTGSSYYFKYGFLDKDVNYIFYYSGIYYFDWAEQMLMHYPNKDASLWNDSQLISYNLGEDDNAKTYSRFFRDYDKDYKKENDPDSSFVKALKQDGMNLCTEEELEKLLDDRAKEIGWDRNTAILTEKELEAIDENFNVIEKDNIENRVFLKEEFSNEKEINEIEETVSYIKENFEMEAKSITGSYKVVSGKREGDTYTVRVEVTEGDNWAELVFPPRDVTFTKDGDTYKFISNKFDWAKESNIDKSYKVDLDKYSGSVYCYIYEYSDANSPSNLIAPGESFIYVVYNGKCITRITKHPEEITTNEADELVEEYLK